MKNITPYFRPGHLNLVVAPWKIQKEIMLTGIAKLAIRGSVIAIDGGDTFDTFRLARMIRSETHLMQPTLDRIRIARAFTCFQMESLLANTPVDHVPKVVLDFLNTFYASNVSETECNLVFDRCMALLQRLHQDTPMAVSIRPPAAHQKQRRKLFDRMREMSDNVILLESVSAAQMPQLF